VNGVAATVDAYGSWEAANVPVLGRGTATFSAVASAAGAGPAVSVTVQQEMPARIVIAEHHADSVHTRELRGLPEETIARGKDHLEWLEADGPDGGWRQHLSAAAERSLTYPPDWSQTIYQWTTTNASAQYADSSGWSAIFPGFSDPFGDITSVPERDVRFPAPGGTMVYYIYHYYARNVSYGWNYPGGNTAAAAVNSRTKMNLYTGGKSGIKRNSLIHLEGWAEQYGRPPGGTGPSGLPWTDTPVTDVVATKIEALGKRFLARSSDSHGDLYVALADNEVKDLNLRVPGVKHYGAWATATRHKLVHETLHPALTDTNLARTSLGVGEYVECWFDPGDFPTNAVWTASGGGSWDTNDRNWVWYTAPSNAASVTVTADVAGTAKFKIKFNVKEPIGYAKPPTHLMSTVPMDPFETRAGAGMRNSVYIGPTDVSFYRVQVKEASSLATNRSGYFTNYPSSGPPHNANWWWNVLPSNRWSDVPDIAEGTFEIPQSGQWVPGEFTWHIPVYWTIGAPSGSRDINPETNALWPSTFMTHWDQQFALDGTGKCTITKFDVTVSRTLNDHYETSETPNPNP